MQKFLIFECTDWLFERLSPFPCLFSEIENLDFAGRTSQAGPPHFGAETTDGRADRSATRSRLPLERRTSLREAAAARYSCRRLHRSAIPLAGVAVNAKLGADVQISLSFSVQVNS